MDATLIRESAVNALVEISQGVSIRLKTNFNQLEHHSVLWALLCGGLRDEIGTLTREEEREFHNGLAAAERLFYKTLQERYNEMHIGDEARFAVETFWGMKHPGVKEPERRNFADEVAKMDLDWERDIIFLFYWDGVDDAISKLIFRVPDEVLATKKHLDELEKHREESLKEVLYNVKVWETGKDYDLLYENVKNVHCDSSNKVVELTTSNGKLYISAWKIHVWEV